MTLDDFLPYILPYAKGCPALVANQATRLAIIELCDKAMIWREYQQPVTTIALQTAYAYAPSANQQVCTLLSLTLAAGEVDVVSPQQGRALDLKAYSDAYAYGTFTGFQLRPAQAAGQAIVTFSTVAPSITATTVPDAFGTYLEAIAEGALSRILTGKDKAYSDIAGAANAMTKWKDAIDDAKQDAQTGSARVTTRTSMVRF